MFHPNSFLDRVEGKNVMQSYTTDTSPEAEEVQLELIRCMPPAQRAMKALRMTTRLIRECKTAIALNNPGLTQQQIGIAFIELNYGDELAAAVQRYLSNRSNG